MPHEKGYKSKRKADWPRAVLGGAMLIASGAKFVSDKVSVPTAVEYKQGMAKGDAGVSEMPLDEELKLAGSQEAENLDAGVPQDNPEDNLREDDGGMRTVARLEGRK